MAILAGSRVSGERGKQEYQWFRLICNDGYLICYSLVDWQQE